MSERGRVKWFNNRTGWGFIKQAQGPDVFVRHDRVLGAGFKVLSQGQTVEYEIRQGPQGPFAVDIVVVATECEPGQEPAAERR